MLQQRIENFHFISNDANRRNLKRDIEMRYHVIISLWLILNLFHYTDCKGGKQKHQVIRITGSGEEVTDSPYALTCSYENVEVTTIIWTKDNNLLYVKDGLTWKKSGLTVTQSKNAHTIKIEHLYLSDSGIYKCLFRTRDNNEISAEKVVDVKPEHFSLKANGQLSLDCLLIGNSLTRSQLVWKRDSQLIVVNGENMVNNAAFKLQKSGNLIITKMAKNLEGEYSCYVNGERRNSMYVSLPAEISEYVSPLKGNKGIALGVCLAIILITVLTVSILMERKGIYKIEWRW